MGERIKEERLETVYEDSISPCRFCKTNIAWLESKKTGKKYCVNIKYKDPAQDEGWVVGRTDFHNCRPKKEEEIPF